MPLDDRYLERGAILILLEQSSEGLGFWILTWDAVIYYPWGKNRRQ